MHGLPRITANTILLVGAINKLNNHEVNSKIVKLMETFLNGAELWSIQFIRKLFINSPFFRNSQSHSITYVRNGSRNTLSEEQDLALRSTICSLGCNWDYPDGDENTYHFLNLEVKAPKSYKEFIGASKKGKIIRLFDIDFEFSRDPDDVVESLLETGANFDK